MNDEARTRAAEALARGEDHDALHVLRWALVWSAQAVARLACTKSDTAAVEAVFLLDDALSEAAELTRTAPQLLAVAEPGPDATAYLQDRQRELAEILSRTLACRQEHEGLAGQESELRAQLEELGAVRTQVAELRRLERLVEALDEIQEQRGVVEERLVRLREHANGTEDAVRLGSTELLRLTEDHLSRLAAPVRGELERASAAQRKLAEAEAQLADAERDAAEASARLTLVRAEHQERVAELDAWTRADRRLVDALAEFTEPARSDGGNDSLERARVLIDAVETRLNELDTALGRALAAPDRATAAGRTVIAWNDGGPAPHSVN